MDKNTRASWGSKLGLVLASAGSAVGLGNLWRFPFLTAQNGGGSFLLIYLIMVVFIGTTLLFTEAALGIKTKADPVNSFKFIHPKLGFIGAVGVLASAVIVPYYSVVGGWISAYLAATLSPGKIENFEGHFSAFISSPVLPICFFAAFLLVTASVVYLGIEKGIEKFCKLTMPLLFILLLLLMIRSLTLEHAWDGVRFFFLPDFSKVNAATFLEAMGQVFFSASVGMGVYITYGSYVRDPDVNVAKTMSPVIFLDTLVSLLTGLTIFPAVFAFGVPMDSGPSLIFITLPKIFASIPFGTFFGFVFFMILLGAALTSSISLMEVVATFLCDQLKMTRKAAVTYYSSVCFVIGCLVSLSFGKLNGFTIGGKIFFDQLDYLASNILLPAGGLLTAVSVGWILGAKNLKVFQNKHLQALFGFMLKWVSPAAVMLVLLHAVGLI